MKTTLSAGVIGTGYLGRFHAQKYASLPGVRLAGVFDPDPARAAAVAGETGTRAFSDLPSLLAEADLVSVAAPTRLHHQVGRQALEAGVHLLVEKPMTATVEEADDLIRLARDRGLTLAVGHLERFNPVIIELIASLGGGAGAPRFIESDRLAGFKPRGTDVNVVLDLMIHDIDIILSLEPSPVTSVEALGVAVLTRGVDIANARLAFQSGCVADVTASRVSREPLRKMRIFCDDAYLSLDYQARRISLYRKAPGAETIPGLPGIALEEKEFPQGDPLQDEIAAFVKAVRGEAPPPVAGEDGRRALQMAIRITEELSRRRTP